MAPGVCTPAVYVLEYHPEEKPGHRSCHSTASALREKPAWNSLLWIQSWEDFRSEVASLQAYMDHITETHSLLQWQWEMQTYPCSWGTECSKCPRTQKGILRQKRMWVVYVWWLIQSGRHWHLSRMSRLTTTPLLQKMLWVNLKWLQMVRCWFCMSFERQYRQQNSAF